MRFRSAWWSLLVLPAALAGSACSSYTLDTDIVSTCNHAQTADDLIKYCDKALNSGHELSGYMAAPAHNSRGLGHMMKQEYDLALADFNQAISYENYEPILYLNRGDAYLAKQDFDRAIADYDHALEQLAAYPEAHLHRGLAYLWKHNTERALGDFDVAVRLGGNADANALEFRAIGYIAEHDYDNAAADFRRALDLKPDSAAVEDGLCRTLPFTGHTYEALRYCERAVKASAKPEGPLFARGYVELRNGAWKAALADCDTATRLNPIPAAALFCRAYAHERLGEGDAAKTDYAAARAADPKIDEGMKRMGIVPGSPGITPEM